jgi:hypothetical protein
MADEAHLLGMRLTIWACWAMGGRAWAWRWHTLKAHRNVGAKKQKRESRPPRYKAEHEHGGRLSLPNTLLNVIYYMEVMVR